MSESILEIASPELDVALEADRIHRAYIDVFRSESGKLVLAHFEKQCGIFELRTTIDPNQAIFDDGSQFWYRYIRQQLDTPPDRVARLAAQPTEE